MISPILITILISSISFAQLSNSSISGIITDKNGVSVRDAAVLAKNIETGFSRGVTSNKDGRYSILSILPGRYEVSVQHVAYRTEKKVVDVYVGHTLTIDFKITTKEIQIGEVVVVSQSEAAALKNSELMD